MQKKTIEKIKNDEDTERTVYVFDEERVQSMAKTNKLSREDTVSLLMSLRKSSIADRYNKVSKKADDNIRDFLLSKGYFKNESEK